MREREHIGDDDNAASRLAPKIAGEKAQAKANTPNPRGWGYALPRRAGDEPDFRRRVDGYFR
jgi:hypothetical protein